MYEEVEVKVRNSDKKDERVTRGELHGNGWSGQKIQGILVGRMKKAEDEGKLTRSVKPTKERRRERCPGERGSDGDGE